MDSTQIAFQGELMLLNWSESSSRGRTVTFLVDDSGEAHPFRDCTIKSGKRAGQRYQCVLVEVDSSEQPVQQRTLAQQAFVYCKDPEFWRWADGRSFDNIDNEDSARAFILNLLQIRSRGDLDKNPVAADGFRRGVMAPYIDFQKQLELRV